MSLNRAMPLSPATRSTTGFTWIGTVNQSLHSPGRSVWRLPAMSIVSASLPASIRNGTSRRRATPRASSSFSAAARLRRRASGSDTPRAASSSA